MSKLQAKQSGANGGLRRRDRKNLKEQKMNSLELWGKGMRCHLRAELKHQ